MPTNQEPRSAHPTMPEFEARLDMDGPRPVVVVRGEIDLSTGPQLADALDVAMSAGRSIELDLRDTTFIDSSAIVILLRAHARLGQGREAIVLSDPAPNVQRILGLAGVDELFTIHSD